MKVSEIHIKNFKRFKDTNIIGLPSESKLVIIVGTNGSGKSSLFDAFHHWYKMNVGFGYNGDEAYYVKEKTEGFNPNRNVNVIFHDSEQGNSKDKKCMYFRTAYRNDPDFNVSSFSRLGAPTDNLRFQRLIDNDQSVSQNYQRLIYSTLSSVYSDTNDEKSVKELREELIGKVKSSMKNVFDDLTLNNIGDPLGDGSFLFEKGTSKSYHYKNLSGGEKSAFDLLLDFIIKLQYYNDTVFFIDEPDSHMHTSLQGKLINELYNVTPDNSQLWLTTHSLGVMRAAKDIEQNTPGHVTILEFDGYDFDTECNMYPVKLDRIVWESFLSIAIGDYSSRIAPEIIVLCEGSITGSTRKNFDADIYNTIFGSEYPQTSFISGGSCTELEKDDHLGFSVLKELLKTSKVYRLLDRDDKSDEEISSLLQRRCIVLKKRHLESYLFDDEVINKLIDTNPLEGKEKQDIIREAAEIKTQAIQESVSRGNSDDDIKSASGEIYNGLKKLLSLTQRGNNPESFMRDTLAPLIKPDMKIYRDLKQDIINPIINQND
jgi:predicted ATPase